MRNMQWQLGTLGTISAFAFRHRETKKNLCRDGRSQDLPNTDFQPAVRHLKASSPASNTCSPMHNANRMGREILRRSVLVCLLITQLLALPATLVSSFVLLPPTAHPVYSSFRHATNLTQSCRQSHCWVCWKSVTVAFPSDYRTHARSLGYEPKSVVRVTATVLGES